MQKKYIFILILLSKAIYGDGEIDTSFGSNGKVTHDTNTTSISHTADYSGRSYTLGLDNSTGETIVYRYKNNGTIDTSFGSNGSISLGNIGNTPQFGINYENEITVGGIKEGNFYLGKIDINGKLESEYTSNLLDTLYTLAIDDERNIISVGKNSDNKLVIFKHDSDLDLVNSFGSSGISTISQDDIDISNGQAYKVKTDSNNDIFIAFSTSADEENFRIAKFNESDGSLDNNFGTDGIASFNSGTNAYSIDIDQNDKIVTVGGGPNSDKFTLARFNTNGTLDTTFNSNGETPGTITESTLTKGTDIKVQPTNEIIAAGRNKDSNSFAISRYKNNGEVDTTFANSGYLSSFDSDSQGIKSLSVQPDNQITSMGADNNGNSFHTRHNGGDLGITLNFSNNVAKGYLKNIKLLEPKNNNSLGLGFDINTNNIQLTSKEKKLLQFIEVKAPKNNNISNNATVTYKPLDDFTGTDTYTFEVSHQSDFKTTATVLLNVKNYGNLSNTTQKIIGKHSF